MRLSTVAGLCGLVLAAGCTNDPYPAADQDKKILYSSFAEAPKTLDPAVAYTTAEHVITGNVFDTLLEYHYLKRPYELIPGLAEAVPKAETLPNGHQSYRFRLRPGILFHADPCFGLSRKGRETREVGAADVAFQLARLADPAVNSPVAHTFGDVLGFAAFRKRLADRRKADPAFAALPAHEQYRRAGGIDGVVVNGDLGLEIVLARPNPQILYWFAMPFTTPVPWEAVAYYDGNEGRPNFADHPVGTGPFRLTVYERQLRLVLERNEAWYGRAPGNANAPGTVFPTDIDKDDIDAGRIDPAYAGRRLPFLDQIRFTREKEGIPRFNKFLQGYYDNSGIIKESFDAIVVGGRLSPEMKARGMRLDKEVEPTTFYMGFNMEDPVVGAPAGEKGRKLRQAMSLALDVEEYLRLFLNGRGVPAQSPLPPGIFGYRKDYQNPFRQPDIARARKLLAEAGYENGIDPATGRPLKLTFDTGNTTAEAFLQYEFMVAGWRQIGLDVEIKATTYNQFQDKVRRGAYQIFRWGWIADFPDPENFLFLLICDNARSKSNGPNTAGFCDAEFDTLYREMKSLPNNARRAELIDRMVAILERERPWIELYHNEAYTLHHAWVVNAKPAGISMPTYKYTDVEPEQRARPAGRVERAGALAALCPAGGAGGGGGARRPHLLPGAPVGWVKRSADPTRARTQCCNVGSSPGFHRTQPTFRSACEMVAYLVRRLAYGALTVLGVLLLLFVLFFAVTDPDDIARKAVGERARPEVYVQWKKNHGYDRPMFYNSEHGAADGRRYTDTLLFEHFRRMLTFDFGRSDADDTPIGTRLWEGAGPSLSLTLPLFVLGLVIGVAIALSVAFFRETYIDRAVLLVCMLTMSVAGLLYIIGGQYLVGLVLRWFPISGFDPNASVIARFLALPVLIGVLTGFGADVRFYRTVFIEEMNRDYVRTARAKGAGDARVMLRHVLRNALIPILTNIVIAIPFLFMGALLLESFFGIPGLGSLTVDAIHGNDFSMIRTVVFLGALLFILGQLLTDLSYALVDPRVRLS